MTTWYHTRQRPHPGVARWGPSTPARPGSRADTRSPSGGARPGDHHHHYWLSSSLSSSSPCGIDPGCSRISAETGRRKTRRITYQSKTIADWRGAHGLSNTPSHQLMYFIVLQSAMFSQSWLKSHGWKHLLALSHLRHYLRHYAKWALGFKNLCYANQPTRPLWPLCRHPNFTSTDHGLTPV